DTSRFNAAVYGQASAPAGSHLSLNGGVRIEDNQRFGTFVTGRLGIVYRTAVAGGLRIRGSAGNAFKEPTFYENYAQGFVKGNPDLRPEQSRSWELGVERRLGPDVLVTLTYFAQHFRDMIDYVGTPPTPGGSNYLNVAAATACGAEVEVGLTPRSAISLPASS